MAAKLNKRGSVYEFHCPCGVIHAFSPTVHTWNGSLDKPTLQPSLLCDSPGMRCHSYMTDGKIKFCTDSYKFPGQEFEVPDWDQQPKESKPMAEKKEFKPGDPVKLLAGHVAAIAAVVVMVMGRSPDAEIVCRISSSEHPSGHSQLGTLVMFPVDQLEAQEQNAKKQIEL
jgi:hypothetical protein